jgi:hypothetical protein
MIHSLRLEFFWCGALFSAAPYILARRMPPFPPMKKGRGRSPAYKLYGLVPKFPRAGAPDRTVPL